MFTRNPFSWLTLIYNSPPPQLFQTESSTEFINHVFVVVGFLSLLYYSLKISNVSSEKLAKIIKLSSVVLF